MYESLARWRDLLGAQTRLAELESEQGAKAELYRVVAREVTDPGKVTETGATTLAINLERASDVGEFKAVASLADVWTRIVGARAPERHEHAHVVAQFEQLPAAAKRARLLEARAKIDAALDALPMDE